jgi:toxin ParE1/3/4
MSKYILSPQAQTSLKQIRSYTLKNHGKQQASKYIKMLRDCMRDTAKNPDTKGTARDEIKEGYYSVFVGKHTIYYRIRDTHIDIIDVLHQSMEAKRHI